LLNADGISSRHGNWALDQGTTLVGPKAIEKNFGALPPKIRCLLATDIIPQLLLSVFNVSAPTMNLLMRSALCLSLFLSLACLNGSAQEGDPGPATLTVRSTLVEVPAMVKTKSGEVVFELTADDFTLTDDGTPQHLSLDPDTDSQPLALVICVETGGAGAAHLGDYQDLDANLDALIGNVEHRVAVVGFDSTPRLLLPFTPNTADASRQLANLPQGNPGASILDAVAFAVEQLRAQPPRYRRAILLLSETLDQGSTTTLTDALRLISDTNTTMYAFAFSSTHSAP